MRGIKYSFIKPVASFASKGFSRVDVVKLSYLKFTVFSYKKDQEKCVARLLAVMRHDECHYYLFVIP